MFEVEALLCMKDVLARRSVALTLPRTRLMALLSGTVGCLKLLMMSFLLVTWPVKF